MSERTTIGLLGYGEVGRLFGSKLSGAAQCSAYDIYFDTPADAARAADDPVERRPDPTALADGAECVISAVTAASAVDAAASVADGLAPGTFFVDVNSASPAAKQAAADLINKAGARYVEAALMSPVASRDIATPLLLGGPHAASFANFAAPLGFSNMRVVSADYGVAAAAKLCRSIIVKGMEALVAEAMLTADAYDVSDAVIASLSDLFPGVDWAGMAPYMIERSLTHGARRAAEMEMAATMIRDGDVAPLMADATVERHAWAGGQDADAPLARLLEKLERAAEARRKGAA